MEGAGLAPRIVSVLGLLGGGVHTCVFGLLVGAVCCVEGGGPGEVRLKRRREVLEFFQKVLKACGRFEQFGDSFLKFRILDALNDEVSFDPIFGLCLPSEHQVSSEIFCILLNVAPIERSNFHFQRVSLILFTVILPLIFVHTSTYFCERGKSR